MVSKIGKIAFTRRNNRNEYFVVIINEDGKGEKVLTEGIHPRWSPDKKHIAFHTSKNNISHIYISDLAGDIEKYCEGSHPSWSPDGSKLAFQRPRFGGGPSDTNIYIKERQADLPNQVTMQEGRYGHGNPIWTPDSSKIFFDSPSGVYFISIGDKGENYQRICDGGYPAISNDGKYLLRSSNGRILLSRIDGSDSKDLGEGKFPAWSPENDRIVFSIVIGPSEAHLALCKTDGSGRQIILRDGLGNTYPSWA